MTTMNTDGKIIGNLVYHAAVITALEIGYAQLTNKIMKQAVPNYSLTVIIWQCLCWILVLQ